MPKGKQFAAGLLGAGVAVLILLMTMRPLERTWTLPDGSTLHLLKITSGTNHICRYGNRLRDYLYPVVPARYRTNFNFQVASLSTSAEGLVLWMERTSGTNSGNVLQSRLVVSPSAVMTGSVAAIAGKIPMQNLIVSPQPFAYSIVDGSGVETQPLLAVPKAGMAGGAELDACLLPGYPRRAEKLRFRLYWGPTSTASPLFLSSVIPVGSTIAPQVSLSSNSTFRTVLSLPLAAASSGSVATVPSAPSGLDTSLTADIEIPNPRRQKLPPPGWTPEPLPANRRTNNLEVTLVNFETACTAFDASFRYFSRAAFAIRENGRLTRDWIATRIVLSNEAGEVLQFSNLVDHGVVEFPATLWMEEPAWKMEVDLKRIGNLRPEDFWKIRGIPVPNSGQTLELNEATNIHGAQLKLVAVCEDTVAAQIQLVLQAPPSIGLNAVELKDDQGRAIVPSGWLTAPTSVAGTSATTADRRLGLFPIPPGARTLDVTFGVRQTLRMEFCVKPVVAGEKAGATKQADSTRTIRRAP